MELSEVVRPGETALDATDAVGETLREVLGEVVGDPSAASPFREEEKTRGALPRLTRSGAVLRHCVNGVLVCRYVVGSGLVGRT